MNPKMTEYNMLFCEYKEGGIVNTKFNYNQCHSAEILIVLSAIISEQFCCKFR